LIIKVVEAITQIALLSQCQTLPRQLANTTGILNSGILGGSGFSEPVAGNHYQPRNSKLRVQIGQRLIEKENWRLAQSTGPWQRAAAGRPIGAEDSGKVRA
jgi:hypothetical protein